MDAIFINILSDLFVNLSAGWFGASLVVQHTEIDKGKKIKGLMTNVFFGILSLAEAYILKMATL